MHQGDFLAEHWGQKNAAWDGRLTLIRLHDEHVACEVVFASGIENFAHTSHAAVQYLESDSERTQIDKGAVLYALNCTVLFNPGIRKTQRQRVSKRTRNHGLVLI